MPSPIAHAAVGYAIYRITRSKQPTGTKKRIFKIPLLLLSAVFFSLLPDIDAVPGVLTGDFRAFHNQGTHSLVVALGVALLAAGVASWLKSGPVFWLGITFVAYALHVLMDGLTLGTRGVMLFWPVLTERYAGPVRMFLGVEWSEGLFHPVHLLTIATELVFAAVIAASAHWVEERQRRMR